MRFEGDDFPSLHELSGGEPRPLLVVALEDRRARPTRRLSRRSRRLADELEAVAASTYLSPAFSTQAIVFEFLNRGLLEPNVERVCGLLRVRRDALLAALERELPDASWSTPAGGYFLWLDLPGDLSAREVLAAGEEAGVTFVPGGDFFARPEDGRARRASRSASRRRTRSAKASRGWPARSRQRAAA